MENQRSKTPGEEVFGWKRMVPNFRKVAFDLRSIRQNPTKTGHGMALEVNRALEDVYKRIAEVEENNRRQSQGFQLASRLAAVSTDLTPIMNLIASLEKDFKVYATDARGVEKLEELKKTFLENRANNLKEVGQELSNYILQPFENFLVSVQEANEDRKRNRVGSMLGYVAKGIFYVAIPMALVAGSVVGFYSLSEIRKTKKEVTQISSEFDKKANLFNKRAAQYSVAQGSQERKIKELTSAKSELEKKLAEAEEGLVAVNFRLNSTDSSVLTLYGTTDNLTSQYKKLSTETQEELKLVNSRLNSTDSSVSDLQTTNGILAKQYEKLVADNSAQDARLLKLSLRVDDVDNSVEGNGARLRWLVADCKYLQERLDQGYLQLVPTKTSSSGLLLQIPNSKLENSEDYKLIRR